MAEQKNRWNWEVSGFEPRKSDDQKPPSSPLVRRYSISASGFLPHSDVSKPGLASKLQRLKDKVKVKIFLIFFFSQCLFLWLDCVF